MLGRLGQGKGCFQFTVGMFEVVYEVVQSFSKVFTLNGLAGVLDHLSGVLQNEAEDIPVDLFLDWIKIERFLFAEGLEAVWVIDDGQVLVDQTNREHIAVRFVRLLQEVHCMGAEVFRRSPYRVTFNYWRFSGSSERVKRERG